MRSLLTGAALAGGLLLLFQPSLASASDAGVGDAFERATEYDYEPPAPGTYELPRLKEAGDGAALKPDGSRARLRRLMRGKITLLSFIYTRCGDANACPKASSVLARIHAVAAEDSALTEGLRLLTMSFDPGHDTPDVMARYGRHVRPGQGGPEWLFLTTASNEDLAPILERYGQRVDPKKDPNDPLGPLSHLLRVYLIDREGEVRNIYSSGLLDPRLVLADIRTLLIEERVPSKRSNDR